MVYPNPSTKVLNVLTQESIGLAQVELVNEIGVRVFSKSANLIAGKQETIQVAALPAGNYFLIIRSNKNNQIVSKEQIVIMK